jgi:hypothetical protein
MWISGLRAFDKHGSGVIVGDLSGWEMGADDLFGAGENLFEGHGGGVEDDGVGGGLERGFGAVAVAIVALFEVAEDGLLCHALLLGSEGIGCLVDGYRWSEGVGCCD